MPARRRPVASPRPSTVRAADSPSAQGYTPFEGQELRGQVLTTFLRGQVVDDRGGIVGPARGAPPAPDAGALSGLPVRSRARAG